MCYMVRDMMFGALTAIFSAIFYIAGYGAAAVAVRLVQ